jgi:hypothetical protein
VDKAGSSLGPAFVNAFYYTLIYLVANYPKEKLSWGELAGNELS